MKVVDCRVLVGPLRGCRLRGVPADAVSVWPGWRPVDAPAASLYLRMTRPGRGGVYLSTPVDEVEPREAPESEVWPGAHLLVSPEGGDQ